MGKYKESPKYNVVSVRISDEEMLMLEEMTRQSRKSKSRLMREAILLYTPSVYNMRQTEIRIPETCVLDEHILPFVLLS